MVNILENLWLSRWDMVARKWHGRRSFITNLASKGMCRDTWVLMGGILKPFLDVYCKILCYLIFIVWLLWFVMAVLTAVFTKFLHLDTDSLFVSVLLNIDCLIKMWTLAHNPHKHLHHNRWIRAGVVAYFRYGLLSYWLAGHRRMGCVEKRELPSYWTCSAFEAAHSIWHCLL